MTPMLTYVLLAVLLTFALAVIAVLLAIPEVGLPKLAGNRENMAELPGVAGRAQRAHHNMLESLVLFVALALVAQMANRVDDTALLGAQVFLVARVAHALVYIAGIAWLRTGVWAISIIGLAMIARALF